MPIEVAVLPEGSFYGELPGLLNIRTYFSLKTKFDESQYKDKTTRQIEAEEYLGAMVYTIDIDPFKELCKDYPEFGSHIYVRGEIRTAYFKHMSQIRQG